MITHDLNKPFSDGITIYLEGSGKGQGPKPGSQLNAFNCSVEVENIDETIAKIKAAGGSIVRDKAQIPGAGWLAMSTDTEGNVFGIMQR